VDLAREHLLADPGLAEQEHADVARRREARLRIERLHRRLEHDDLLAPRPAPRCARQEGRRRAPPDHGQRRAEDDAIAQRDLEHLARPAPEPVRLRLPRRLARVADARAVRAPHVLDPQRGPDVERRVPP
jgi:hypothetical protein